MQSQVIDLSKEQVIVFDAENVIHNITQIPIDGVADDEIAVTVSFYNTYTGLSLSPINVVMTYQPAVDMWFIPLSSLAGASRLIDRQKYVGRVIENTAITTRGLRSFKINEFCTDNNSFEDTIMRLPYQVVISGGEAYIRWYSSVAAFVAPDTYLYQAPAYEGGSGYPPVFATATSRVTHRGPITASV